MWTQHKFYMAWEASKGQGQRSRPRSKVKVDAVSPRTSSIWQGYRLFPWQPNNGHSENWESSKFGSKVTIRSNVASEAQKGTSGGLCVAQKAHVDFFSCLLGLMLTSWVPSLLCVDFLSYILQQEAGQEVYTKQRRQCQAQEGICRLLVLPPVAECRTRSLHKAKKAPRKLA